MSTKGISVREFARRDGVSHTLVFQALKSGKLVKLPDGTLDPALVGTGWRASARVNQEPREETPEAGKPPSPASGKDPEAAAATAAASGAPGSGLPYGEALRLKENFLALLRRLEYQHKSGSLVEIQTARDVLFELCREQRDIWLAWPARVAPLIAARLGIDDLDTLTEALTAHVYEQLAELGEPDAHFETGQA